MRKLKDALRLKLIGGQSHQEIATALGIAKGSVTKYCALAATVGLDWDAIEAMSETDLEQRLFGSAFASTSVVGQSVTRPKVLRLSTCRRP